MTHRHKTNSHHRELSKSRQWLLLHSHDSSIANVKPRLDFVLKCDSMGSLEAVTAAISGISISEVNIEIIHSETGDITKSDVFVAATGGRLITGYQVNVLPGVDKLLKESGVEVRIYDVIYDLTSDLHNIAQSLIPADALEQVIGSARVIKLFKSSRKGIIIGCEIMNGHLALGQHFRVISAVGPVYAGTIESMHIEDHAVQKAVPGQQVGIKTTNFNRVKIGDLVESYRTMPSVQTRVWQPKGEIIRK